MREMDTESPVIWPAWCYAGDTTSADPETTQAQAKPRKRRSDRNNDYTNHHIINNNNNNNNNHTPVKNERLSPGTPDTSSRSRSVTPSSASHPGTPPGEHPPPFTALAGRNYSDFMRSLAAKYNNANPNDYFGAARNGFPPNLDARFKPSPSVSALLPTSKDSLIDATKKNDFSSILGPFTSNPLFPPLMDMSTTQTLIAMVRTAKEAELQTLLKSSKRTRDSSSPLDLSAAAPLPKRARKAPKRSESASPRLQEDVSSWSVDDVSNFVAGIDICAEYATNFKEQRIDGSGLPLLTEEHLTSTMNMKLGPALKLRSILAKKIGSCRVCLHCSHCHTATTPDPGNTPGTASDSGGGTS